MIRPLSVFPYMQLVCNTHYQYRQIVGNYFFCLTL